jgi:hypothetical protein
VLFVFCNSFGNAAFAGFAGKGTYELIPGRATCTRQRRKMQITKESLDEMIKSFWDAMPEEMRFIFGADDSREGR